ncbi:unnamed protein product [Arctogadus glacialis]
MDLVSTPQIHVWGRRHGNGERWGSETRLLVSGAAPCMPTSRVLQRPAGQVEELNLNGYTDLVVVNPSTRLYFGFVLVFVFRCLPLRHPEFVVVLVSQGRIMKLQ